MTHPRTPHEREYQSWYYHNVTKPRRQRDRPPVRPKSDDVWRTHPLYQARSRKGLTQREVVERMNVPASLRASLINSFSRWEHDRYIPESLYAELLAPVLDFDSGDALRQACIAWREQQVQSSRSSASPSSEANNEFSADSENS